MNRLDINLEDADSFEPISQKTAAKNWSQQQLADQFGVSRAAVSQFEIGTGEVNAEDLPRLGELFGISLLEFYEGPQIGLRVNCGEGSKARPLFSGRALCSSRMPSLLFAKTPA